MSLVVSTLVMVIRGAGLSSEIRRLGMPKPRESSKKAVRRITSLPSALAVKGEAKR